MDRRVLVVDVTPDACRPLAELLAEGGAIVKLAHDPLEALEWLADGRFDLLVASTRVLPGPVLDWLKELRGRVPDTPLLLLTNSLSESPAQCDSLVDFAENILLEPIDPESVRLAVDHAFDSRERRLVQNDRCHGLRTRHAVETLVGTTPALRAIKAVIPRIQGDDSPILIRGETGTGKTKLACVIHNAYRDSARPILRLDPRDVPEHLVESALFGHEARALPDSERTHSGLIERASESVLVENLEDLTKETQRKLLAAIQKRHFTRVGGTERIETRVRFIATTSADLDDLVRSGQVLADLRDCLGTIAFDLPPLRSRISDLPALAEQFLAKERVGSNDTERPRLNRRALDALEAHTWPGNLRELRDVMRSVALTARCREVDSNGLPPNLAGRAQTPGSALTPDFEPEIDLLHPLPSLVRSANERAERCYLELLLERNAGRIDATARASGLSRRSISAKLNKYGINKDRFKTPRGSESIRMGD